jgi:transcription initiation factor TFIID subunit 1
MKKSKIILQQLFKRQRQEEEEQIETQIAQIADKDPFNLSNDDYYLPKNNTKSQRSLVSTTIQHSLPAQNINPTFFPYLANITQIRHFHKPHLPAKLLHLYKSTPIHSLTRHIRITNQRRERQIGGTEGGSSGFDIFLMREMHDLTGRDGQLLLLEYSEQYPPFINQPGMASKIRNYFKRV